MYNSISTVLVVEDDKSLQSYLRELLTINGYSVQTASDGIAALNIINKAQPDLILLDLGLPQMKGETVCLEVKKKFPELPIVILTGQDSISDIVQGLNLGADDYMTKPFVSDELLARVRARLRKNGTVEPKLKMADLEVDSQTFEVRRAGKEIHLTPKEFKLLHYLMSNKGKVLTREMILNKIWLYAPDIESRVVDIYMGYLRKKVDSGFDPKLIHSIRGFGYTMKDKESSLPQ
jgi:DNA-binding response OmpR family regulator